MNRLLAISPVLALICCLSGTAAAQHYYGAGGHSYSNGYRGAVSNGYYGGYSRGYHPGSYGSGLLYSGSRYSGSLYAGSLYSGGVYVAPVLPPPASVRIRTPFFSMDTGPGYSRYGVGSSAIYGFGSPLGYSAGSYGLYAPAYPSTAPLYDPLYPSYVPSDLYGTDAYGYDPSVAPRDDLYQPGIDGGIPEVSVGRPAFTPSSQPAGAVNLLALRMSADVLRQNLERRRDDADIWLDYLSPDRVIAAIDAGQPDAGIAELADHYEGVAGNTQLRWLLSTPGFEATRRGLRQWVSQSAATGEPRDTGAGEGSILGPESGTATRPAETRPAETLPTETLPTPVPEVLPAE
ncbi:hypothetical protein [Stieleria varia]|uniref:hypothetical protein n=1 Tax=Stieleria varia TaxID=2528005 RepID=UPI0011B54548|nr:hypothetical protein [Stieleria varia]